MIPTEQDYREFLEELDKVFNLGILYDQLTDEESNTMFKSHLRS